MKKMNIPVGVSDFEEIRKNGYYYIDKSGLVRELLSRTGTKVTLITRPRRFGAKAPEYTVVYDGFVNGEMEAVLTGTLVVTCDYTVESRESAYEIVPSGLSAKNYAITWKNGVLTARS